jgi:VCBS repeat-containing protein
VAAPGVLANDTDANGDSLTAVLVATVGHGSLTLNANGSFQYTPTAGYSGSDSFTYKANDGRADSNTVTVTITVAETMGTFGLDAGNNTWTEGSNILDLMRFQNTVGSGYLATLELQIASSTTIGKVRLGVYADVGGVPGTLLLDAGEAIVVNGWVSISGLSLPVTGNSFYWLAFKLQSSNGVRYQSGRPASSHYWMSSAYGVLPGQFSLSGWGSNNNQYVMRATVKKTS